MTQTIKPQGIGGSLHFHGREISGAEYNKHTVKARYFSTERWRTSTFGGKYIILQGIGIDGTFNGELKTVPLWWFSIWYQRIEQVSSEKFTARRIKGVTNV